MGRENLKSKGKGFWWSIHSHLVFSGSTRCPGLCHQVGERENPLAYKFISCGLTIKTFLAHWYRQLPFLDTVVTIYLDSFCISESFARKTAGYQEQMALVVLCGSYSFLHRCVCHSQYRM